MPRHAYGTTRRLRMQGPAEAPHKRHKATPHAPLAAAAAAAPVASSDSDGVEIIGPSGPSHQSHANEGCASSAPAGAAGGNGAVRGSGEGAGGAAGGMEGEEDEEAVDAWISRLSGEQLRQCGAAPALVVAREEHQLVELRSVLRVRPALFFRLKFSLVPLWGLCSWGQWCRPLHPPPLTAVFYMLLIN